MAEMAMALTPLVVAIVSGLFSWNEVGDPRTITRVSVLPPLDWTPYVANGFIKRASLPIPGFLPLLY